VKSLRPPFRVGAVNARPAFFAGLQVEFDLTIYARLLHANKSEQIRLDSSNLDFARGARALTRKAAAGIVGGYRLAAHEARPVA
jgi:hypothetical protein